MKYFLTKDQKSKTKPKQRKKNEKHSKAINL